MNYKLVYHATGRFSWGITMWIGDASRWIEQAQFLLRMDALSALQRLNKYGYLR